MEREVGGGIGMGKTCKLKDVSFQCMTKFTTKKKKKKKLVDLVFEVFYNLTDFSICLLYQLLRWDMGAFHSYYVSIPDIFISL